MYDCKLMEIRRAFFAGWMGCGALFFVADGGWRMAPVSPAVRFRAGGSGGGVGRLAEVGIDEGWRIEWMPGSWMSHQRCAGWLGGKAEFLVEAIVAVLDGWEKG